MRDVAGESRISTSAIICRAQNSYAISKKFRVIPIGDITQGVYLAEVVHGTRTARFLSVI
jgi:hypothetical protein